MTVLGGWTPARGDLVVVASVYRPCLPGPDDHPLNGLTATYCHRVGGWHRVRLLRHSVMELDVYRVRPLTAEELAAHWLASSPLAG